MVAPKPMDDKAYLGMRYKYIRDVPTTLAVNVRHENGKPNRYYVIDDRGKLILQTQSDGTKTNIIFDGEGGELLTMTPNFISFHHSISGTHGGLDCFKGSVHSGSGGESEYRAQYTNHDTNVTTECDYYGPWEEHDGKIIDHTDKDTVLALVCREDVFEPKMPKTAYDGPGSTYFVQVIPGVDLASVACISVAFDMILEREEK